MTGWRLHDLRRTARSLMSRAGVSADIAERCLGHIIGGVRAVYGYSVRAIPAAYRSQLPEMILAVTL